MLFRQLFDSKSSTYTYLIAKRTGGEALIIDPVYQKVDHYARLLTELDCKLAMVIDTHVHADHVTAAGALFRKYDCAVAMGEKTTVETITIRAKEDDILQVDGIDVKVIYTPGHTDDSYSFLMNGSVFTGDTLLIRGSGRTDFQNGDARAQYDSIFNKLLKLPDETLVYPAHDYKGDMVSTIAEERNFNPRLQVSNADEYAEIMDNLNLPNPQMMDIAVPENLKMGLEYGSAG